MYGGCTFINDFVKVWEKKSIPVSSARDHPPLLTGMTTISDDPPLPLDPETA